MGDIFDKDAFALERCVNMMPNTETKSLETIERGKACSSEMAFQNRGYSCFNELLGYNVNCAFYQGPKRTTQLGLCHPVTFRHEMAEPD